jgi:hypothetical protein
LLKNIITKLVFMKIATFSPKNLTFYYKGVNPLYWRIDQRISPQGDNLTPRGQTLLEDNLAPGVKVCP